MREWLHEIDIKSYITDETETSAIIDSLIGVYIELSKLAYTFSGEDNDYENLLYSLKTALETYPHIRNDYVIEGYNNLLNNIYDWADNNKVWLGL